MTKNPFSMIGVQCIFMCRSEVTLKENVVSHINIVWNYNIKEYNAIAIHNMLVIIMSHVTVSNVLMFIFYYVLLLLLCYFSGCLNPGVFFFIFFQIKHRKISCKSSTERLSIALNTMCPTYT